MHPIGALGFACASARLAVRFGAKGKLVQLLARVKGRTPLHAAAERGDTELCKLLLEAKADATKRLTLWGLTPLENARFAMSSSRRGGHASSPIESLLGSE